MWRFGDESSVGSDPSGSLREMRESLERFCFETFCLRFQREIIFRTDPWTRTWRYVRQSKSLRKSSVKM